MSLAGTAGRASLSVDLGARAAVLAHALARVGWNLRSMEIDLHAETARIEIGSADGRRVTLDARGGRVTLTREHVSTYVVPVGRRGDIYLAERLRTEFLGRSRHEGLRSGMRSLAHYLADNAPAAALPRETARRALAPLLDGWAR